MAQPTKNMRSDKRFPTLALTVTILLAVFLALVLLVVPKSDESGGTTAAVSRSESTLTTYNKVALPEAQIDVTIREDVGADSGEPKVDVEVDADVDGAKESKEAEDTLAAELSVENTESEEDNLITQAKESVEEKEVTQIDDENESLSGDADAKETDPAYNNWKLCSSMAGTDYIPCLDNVKAIKSLKTTKHYEHRERHCPSDDESRLCLVPLPDSYKTPIPWPRSRNEVWYSNVPHTSLISYKADQKWVVRKENVLIFPGGGTQFKKGAHRYIEFIEKTLPPIAWGKHTRVILDVGCGVASFGGYLFDKDVLTMSFAPKDEHEAQVQFALERGIPAISAVMGTTRLPFPSNAYDAVHCARCRVPWHLEGAKLLVELNRVLRPGGYFIWSATPVYQKEPEDVEIWKATTAAAAKLCWQRLSRTRDPQTGIGVAIFQKPVDNDCYNQRSKEDPAVCEEADSADSAWYVPLGSCIHEIDEARAKWPEAWPSRVEATPELLVGAAAEEFHADTEQWKSVVHATYQRKLGINWDSIRNVMDMRAGYGGFAAALVSLPVWVMNVVPMGEADTLPVIFHRGLFGIYHDWCESFSTYPRSYDLLHADGLFSHLGESCNASYVALEMDRILRPEGWVIVRDTAETLKEVVPIFKSLHWEMRTGSEKGVIAAQKKTWRPDASI